jgi:hypothetical protein
MKRRRRRAHTHPVRALVPKRLLHLGATGTLACATPQPPHHHPPTGPPHRPSPAQERLEREYDLDLITTAPTVVYKCVTTDGTEMVINSPGDLPDATKRESISEPYVRLEMVTPKVGVAAVEGAARVACFSASLGVGGKGWSRVSMVRWPSRGRHAALRPRCRPALARVPLRGAPTLHGHVQLICGR